MTAPSHPAAGMKWSTATTLYQNNENFRKRVDDYDLRQDVLEKENFLASLKPFPQINFNIDNHLLCPSCHSTFLHHWKVIGYNRKNGEDSDPIVSVYMDDGVPDRKTKYPNLNEKLPKNPSYRRNAISIHFWCEGCCSIPKLNIIQRKGETHIEWDEDLS